MAPNFAGRVAKCVHSLLACLSRLLCFVRRQRRPSDAAADLPFTVVVASGDFAPGGSQFETTWQQWDKPASTVDNKIREYRERLAAERRKASEAEHEASQCDELLEAEKALLGELEPQKIRSKKVVVRKKSRPSSSSMFDVIDQPTLPPASSELGTLADDQSESGGGGADAWDECDAQLDVTAVVRQARHDRRMHRLQQKRHNTGTAAGGTGVAMEAVKIGTNR